MARLLNTYQLWLDDLYPRAKFTDALSMVEKLGHKKRMQVMRKAWIDEGKPKPVDDSSDDPVLDEYTGQDQRADSLPQDLGNPATDFVYEESNQDHSVQSTALQDEPVNAEQADEDELDALLAETDLTTPKQASLFGLGAANAVYDRHPNQDAFMDEEEAMAEMDW